MTNKEVDWIIHGVFEDGGKGSREMDGGYIDYHTHGMAKYLDGMELSIYLGLPRELAMCIINTLGLLVKHEEIILKPGTVLDSGIVCNLECRIIQAPMINNPTDKTIQTYRIILPDQYGNFPEDEGCSTGFKFQARQFIIK